MYADNPGAPSVQQLTFSLAGEQYGLDILGVREIRGWVPVTRIPQLPAHLLGVLNLRGAIVPIMDMRLRFGLPRDGYGEETVVVVVAAGDRFLGIVVDSVSDVIEIDPAQIKPVPDMVLVDTRYLRGLAPHDGHLVMLLDVDKLMRPEDIETLEAVMPDLQEIEAVA